VLSVSPRATLSPLPNLSNCVALLCQKHSKMLSLFGAVSDIFVLVSIFSKTFGGEGLRFYS
jgi:hypothetical protein